MAGGAGICLTSTKIIHLLTLPTGTDGPEAWAATTLASEPEWVTYYLVTDG